MFDTQNTSNEIDVTEEIITIRWTITDVLALLVNDDDNTATVEEAVERARSWASAITDTANNLISEQLASVIQHDTP